MHRLGVVAFDITGWDNESSTNAIPMENIRKAEDTFVKLVENELENDCERVAAADKPLPDAHCERKESI